MGAMSIRITSVDNDGSTLELERPVVFDVDHTQGNRVYHSDFITDCGLHNLTIEQSVDLGPTKNGINHLARVEYAAKFWVKNCKFNRPLAHPIRTTWVVNSIFEDSTYDNCWARGEGGGNGYYGPQTSTDCLYRNCHLEFLRHLACEEYSIGNLIDNVTGTGVDLNFHKQFPRHNLFQRVVINDNTEAVTLRGETNRDIYSILSGAVSNMKEMLGAVHLLSLG